MNIQYKPFDLIDTIRDNNLSYTHSFTKKVTTADANVEKLQDKAESFRKSVKKLKRYSPGGISREMLTDQAEDLVKSYNAMKNSSDQVTDKDVQKQLAKLDKLFSDNERTLRKAGIEKLNGKYTFDRSAFAEASEKTVNALFPVTTPSSEKRIRSCAMSRRPLTTYSTLLPSTMSAAL